MKSDKMVYTTDDHITMRQPHNRSDDFLSNILDKERFIVDYVNRNEIDHWLMGGDMFDTPHQNCELINMVGDIFKDSCANITSIPGNHLIKGNFIRSMERSGLTTLEMMGILDIVEDPHIFVAPNTGVKFLLAHEMIVESSKPWPHKTYKDIAAEYKGRVHVVLCSHYHTPQGHKIVDGIHFIAPGSLGRGMGREADPNRIPTFANILITRDKKKTKLTVKFIKVPCVDNPFIIKGPDMSMEARSDDIIEHMAKSFKEFGVKVDFSTVLDKLHSDDKVTDKCNEYIKNIHSDWRSK